MKEFLINIISIFIIGFTIGAGVYTGMTLMSMLF